CLQYNSVPYTF
nr:immunoglobulin light chain junction region [Macaca mulatta]